MTLLIGPYISLFFSLGFVSNTRFKNIITSEKKISAMLLISLVSSILTFKLIESLAEEIIEVWIPMSLVGVVSATMGYVFSRTLKQTTERIKSIGVFTLGNALGVGTSFLLNFISYESLVKIFVILLAIDTLIHIAVNFAKNSTKQISAVIGSIIILFVTINFNPLNTMPFSKPAGFLSNSMTQLKIVEYDHMFPLNRALENDFDFTQIDYTSAKIFGVVKESKVHTRIFSGNTLDDLEFLKQDATFILLNSIKNKNRIAIIGAGGGVEILQSRMAQFNQIDAVEINPLMVRAVEQFSDIKQTYQAHNVISHIVDGRYFISQLPKNEKYSTIIVPNVKSLETSASQIITENFIRTAEAYAKFYEHLEDDGYLIIRDSVDSDLLKDTFLATLAHSMSLQHSSVEKNCLLIEFFRDNSFRKLRTYFFIIKKDGWKDNELSKFKNLFVDYSTKIKKYDLTNLNETLNGRVVTDDQPYPYVYSKKYQDMGWNLFFSILEKHYWIVFTFFFIPILIFYICFSQHNQTLLSPKTSMIQFSYLSFIFGFFYIQHQLFINHAISLNSGLGANIPPIIWIIFSIGSSIAYLLNTVETQNGIYDNKRTGLLNRYCGILLVVLSIIFYAALKHVEIGQLTSLQMLLIGIVFSLIISFLLSWLYIEKLRIALLQEKYFLMIIFSNSIGMLLAVIVGKYWAISLGWSSLYAITICFYCIVAFFPQKNDNQKLQSSL